MDHNDEIERLRIDGEQQRQALAILYQERDRILGEIPMVRGAIKYIDERIKALKIEDELRALK